MWASTTGQLLDPLSSLKFCRELWRHHGDIHRACGGEGSTTPRGLLPRRSSHCPACMLPPCEGGSSSLSGGYQPHRRQTFIPLPVEKPGRDAALHRRGSISLCGVDSPEDYSDAVPPGENLTGEGFSLLLRTWRSGPEGLLHEAEEHSVARGRGTGGTRVTGVTGGTGEAGETGEPEEPDRRRREPGEASPQAKSSSLRLMRVEKSDRRRRVTGQ